MQGTGYNIDVKITQCAPNGTRVHLLRDKYFPWMVSHHYLRIRRIHFGPI